MVDAMNVKRHTSYWLVTVISGVDCNTPPVRGTAAPGAMKNSSVSSANLAWLRARVTTRLAFSNKFNVITQWDQLKTLNRNSFACKNHTVRNEWCLNMNKLMLMWTGGRGASSDHLKIKESAAAISHSVLQRLLRVNSQLKQGNCTIYLSSTCLIVIR